GADLLAAVVGGAVAAWILSPSLLDAAVLTAALLAIWVILGFFCGLYNVSDLQTWASGLSEAPRAVAAALLLPWPICGVAALLGIGQPVLFALVATVATVGVDTVARALGRGWAHRVAPLRQRTVIVGSGLVADRLAERLEQHAEFGLETVGLV